MVVQHCHPDDIEKDTLFNHATRYLHATNDNPPQCHSNAADGSGAYISHMLDSLAELFTEQNSSQGQQITTNWAMAPRLQELLGGTTRGVAEDCTMILVKVVNKLGVSKIGWLCQAILRAPDHSIAKDIVDKIVMNISLGGEYTTVINTAVKKATNSGITLVVSAGNSGVSAVIYSPASAVTAITVAANSPDNRRAPFSNYGPCVNIFAPGVGITSTLISVKQESRRYSGTSSATAYVMGLAAYFISREDLRGYRAVRKRVLYAASLNGVIKDSRWSSNRLEFSGILRN
ncbi:unnamed protein product [Fusarium fujikuroi]|uniref:Peptidase S8/S53 domain-containing protein n=1 Tax=Fusarium fujikuroi TaxID=5127 RepID=A0A9Q9UG27_FUSFU|nr:unnamed protein product [Fusarium fujikuroi]VTT80393.1 unnamed protein product [Fusarium fujikuroi]